VRFHLHCPVLICPRCFHSSAVSLHSHVHAGAGYSAPTLKTQLKMAVQRLQMHRNKKSNQISVDSKQVAILMQQGKDESARIRCEAILHEKNLVTAMELLTLMCELLTARTALVTAAKTCPVDLEEGIASVVYCASRIEIPELKIIAEQFAAKFTKEWVLRHTDNQSGKVNQRIIDKLSIQPPPFEVVLNMLHEIAAQYQVDWQPDMAALESGVVDHSNPARLGTIARISGSSPTAADGAQPIAVPSERPTQQQQSQQQPYPSMLMPRPGAFGAAASSSNQYPIADPHLSAPAIDGQGLSPFPGTLNIVIHRGRNILNLASQSDPHDVYVRVTNLSTGTTFKSGADPNGGSNPIWNGNPNIQNSVCHFPFSVQDATQQLQIELFQQNHGTFNLKQDKLLGQASFYADNLRANPQLQWYGVFLQSMQTGFLLMQTQYIPLNANVVSKEDLERQQMWLQQERQAGVISPHSLPQAMQPPGGPGGPVTEPQYANYVHPTASFARPSSASSDHAAQPGQRSRNSLSDRVKGLFTEHPDSPPHSLKNLSDIVGQQQQPRSSIPASYDSTSVQSQSAGQEAPDVSYHAMRDRQDGTPPMPVQVMSNQAAYAEEEQKSEEDVLDFPAVPTHSAGSGRNGGKPPAATGGGSAGGGTLYAARPPPKVKSKPPSEDESMEERFKRLNQ
jgi:hypothetical protein